ncbi:hypothetical protein A0128_10565 [Leptospira tipperaryensis]|uniref:Uncharacterized protein n=1 Tax=Leptospira tipperaryensis TaxID=2564040 RepID=A0A1D7UXD0_9LEPT|nr:hypothetical protein [Leptospira tipperaryensis]AOP34250.1 hypothetical protein A0128_10565 [Leptospira tipperaryensis]
MNPVFYNYFSGPEEFLTYLKKDRFGGSGMISTPVPKEPYFSETNRKARLELQENQILIFLKGKETSKTFAIPLNGNSKKNELEFLPDYLSFKNGEETFTVRLQPLDRERIHLQIDSKIGLEFSGTLSRLKGWRKWF